MYIDKHSKSHLKINRYFAERKTSDIATIYDLFT